MSQAIKTPYGRFKSFSKAAKAANKAAQLYSMIELDGSRMMKVKYGKTREAKLWSHFQLSLPMVGTRQQFEALIQDSIEASESTRTDVSTMKRDTFSKLIRDNIITLTK